MGYRYLNVLINSANDASISYENFVKFGPAVTPELTELICERQMRHGQKIGYLVEYLWNYWTNFRMKVLWVQMINMDLIFRFGKGRCHGNQIIMS